MRKILTLFLLLSLTFNTLSQKFNDSYIKPNEGDNYVSLYFSINNLKLSKNKSTTTDFDSLVNFEYKTLKNGFNYFAFRVTANVVFYDTKNKSLVGNFVSVNPNGDTLQIVMSEKNGDYLFLDIIETSKDKFIVIIEEKSLNGKTKVYFSDECILERASR
jgi:hypothetical protein